MRDEHAHRIKGFHIDDPDRELIDWSSGVPVTVPLLRRVKQGEAPIEYTTVCFAVIDNKRDPRQLQVWDKDVRAWVDCEIRNGWVLVDIGPG